MKTTILSRSADLENAANVVAGELADIVKNNDYISFAITKTKFNRFDDIVVDADILYRDDGIKLKKVSYIVVNDNIFKSLPQTALCDDKQ